MSYLEKLKDPRWQKKRLEILDRDKWKCIHCHNELQTLHVHHKAYSGNPWEVENKCLSTLCEDCHDEEEKILPEEIKKCISYLKKSGFSSRSFIMLSNIFLDTDRNWGINEPSFSVIKMAIDSDEIWDFLVKLFNEKCQKDFNDLMSIIEKDKNP